MAFTLFCREFGNVVNRAFLVLIFWVKKIVGANFTRFATMHKDYTLYTVHYTGNPPRQKTPHTCDPPAEGTPDPQLTEPPLTPKALLCIVVTRDSIWTHSSDQQYSFAIIKSSREKSATVVQQEHVRRKKYSNDLSSQLSPPILSP